MTRLAVNPGDRPSRLDLARHLTGEAPLAGGLDEAWLAEVVAGRARVPPFDAAVLRAAAARLDDPRPAPARRWAWVLLPVLLAAALLLTVRPPGPGGRLKGDVDLGFYLLRDGQVYPGDPSAAFREGDRLQFTYRAAGWDTLVLLSVDGEGTISRYAPAEGDRPVPVVPGDRRLLDGSVRLDDASGPEVFVAFFAVDSAAEAEALAREAYAAGGPDAVARLGDELPGVAVLVIEKP